MWFALLVHTKSLFHATVVVVVFLLYLSIWRYSNWNVHINDGFMVERKVLNTTTTTSMYFQFQCDAWRLFQFNCLTTKCFSMHSFISLLFYCQFLLHMFTYCAHSLTYRFGFKRERASANSRSYRFLSKAYSIYYAIVITAVKEFVLSLPNKILLEMARANIHHLQI